MSTFAPGHLSGAGTAPAVPQRPVRRVRHQVRDGAVVMAFSAVASTALAGAMLLVVTLVGQGA
jgi:hypothetical protein